MADRIPGPSTGPFTSQQRPGRFSPVRDSITSGDTGGTSTSQLRSFDPLRQGINRPQSPRTEARVNSCMQEEGWTRDREVALHHVLLHPEPQQIPSTDATPEIPSYMSEDALVDQLVTHRRFSDEQISYLVGERELSQQQAGALYNVCREHMKDIEEDSNIISDSMQTIRNAIKNRTMGRSLNARSAGTNFIYP